MTNPDTTSTTYRSFLFLSCDLTGSTVYKQSPSDPNRPWQMVFLQFYRIFPQSLAAIQANNPHYQSLDFKLWKAVGDELIYQCEVKREIDIYRATRAWIAAMRHYEDSSLKKEQLGTKGGAFVATFPGPDSYSSIPRDPSTEDSDADVRILNDEAYKNIDHEKYLYDYFGPSIDTGFRIISECDDRHFTMSVEVARAFLEADINKEPNDDSINVADINILRWKSLKGVWKGKEYPIFAIDLRSNERLSRARATLNGSTEPILLREVCDACLEDEDWPSRMFLSGSSIFSRHAENPMEATPPTPVTGFETTPEASGESDVSPDDLPMPDDV